MTKAGGRPRNPAVDEAIIKAARARLIADGYSKMTIGDVAADAGVTRPTLYRRWATKHDLVVDALRYGYRTQQDRYPVIDLTTLPPIEAIKEAVRRVNPCYANPAAMTLMGDFMAEAERVPDLMARMREHGVRPRCEELLDTLRRLRERGQIRADVDLDAVVTMCFGSYFAAYLRTGEIAPGHADALVDTLWPTLAPRQAPAPASEPD